jgi:hypothetical protein
MEPFAEHIKSAFEAWLATLTRSDVEDAYVVSVALHNEEDDPRKPYLFLGLNTDQQVARNEIVPAISAKPGGTPRTGRTIHSPFLRKRRKTRLAPVFGVSGSSGLALVSPMRRRKRQIGASSTTAQVQSMKSSASWSSPWFSSYTLMEPSLVRSDDLYH